MSSATLQATPHQPTTVSASHSPVAAGAPAVSSLQYQAGSASPQDAYYNQNAANGASSTRRPSGRPSGNGTTTNNAQATQYYSSSGSSPVSQAPNPRPINSAGQAATAVTTSTASSGYVAMAPGDHQRGVPPVVSPRTSSNRNGGGGSSRRSGNALDERTVGSPRGPSSNEGDRKTRERSNGQVNGGNGDATADDAARSRRRQAQHESLPYRPSSNRENRSAPGSSAAQSRSQAAGAVDPTSPIALSREASEVLNRVIVSKPEVDLDRERERMAETIPSPPMSNTSPASERPMGSIEVVEGGGGGSRSGHRSRQDHSSSKRERNTKFGDYYLGATLGEGEFGKVKMGWKQEGGVQVAIKLIRRDSVGTNSTRLAKIYREIAILREVSHPNIVRLHEMVETERQIGIILEYASGGELFDYILNNRYLKDNAARRLFAQLVSGVGYLHKKGIVHRDLKLENLLLDRNRNIIITDFGFANTFNPDDELSDEIEYNLSSREFVKKMELDKILPGGYRRGDLMQTSCGSPCYAAPELVVSDSLYTGRKVDVWSCGVILYAMLAGYLPFDDDPANPEGDNINLLYKYIVSTPLTFPEYVTPHARDLLRRILVPDPRKRADLFEVARHSWLSEYAHVVGFITSSTTSSGDIALATVAPEEQTDPPLLARSASVREPSSKAQKPTSAVGDLSRKHGNVDPDAEEALPKSSKDNKRRTVQVEYVAPRSQTQRGEAAPAPAPVARTRARSGSQGPVEVSTTLPTRRDVAAEKPFPQDGAARDGQHSNHGRQPSNSQYQQAPSRSRAVSDNAFGTPSIARPPTGGSMTSTASRSGQLPTRGSYGQPVAPTVAGTNVHGRMSQPKSGKGYTISAPIPQEQFGSDYGRPSVAQVPKVSRYAGNVDGGAAPAPEVKGHKRSSTIGGIFSRTNSIFGRSSDKNQEKASKKSYPPVSMTTIPTAPGAETPRQSIDSRRSISFGFGKKRSGSITGSQTTLPEKPRRFSALLPQAFSLKAIGLGKDSTPDTPTSDPAYDRADYMEPPQTSRSDPRNLTTRDQQYLGNGAYETQAENNMQRAVSAATPPQHQRYPSQGQGQYAPANFRSGESAVTDSQTSLDRRALYAEGYNQHDPEARRQQAPPPARAGKGVLTKNNRRFTDAYEQEQNNGFGPSHVDNAGSSGAARKVMDFFRRRGRARVE
ncbi:hypothetical protein F5884DRAFT_751635 [Xylogone sp. PMI_703]|nr:hypothetical protein F5884DRAFT_751635 [Xylogone sp. PMI_703]